MQVLFRDSTHKYGRGSGSKIDLSRIGSQRISTRIEKVICGPDYVAALTSHGEVFSTVIATQKSTSDQIQGQDTPPSLPPSYSLTPVARLKGLKVVDIAASAVAIVAVTQDRQVHSIPTAAYGRGEYQRYAVPLCVLMSASAAADISKAKPLLQAAAGAVFFVIACTSTRAVFSAGINQYGQLGVGSIDERLDVRDGPMLKVTFDPALKAPLRMLACGGSHTVALEPSCDPSDNGQMHFDSYVPDCDVWVWGRNHCGQLGIPSGDSGPMQCVSSPTKVLNVHAIHVSCGDNFTILLSRFAGGSLGVCGKNSSGQLGLTSEDDMVFAIRWIPLNTLPSRCQDLIQHPQAQQPSVSSALTNIYSISCGGGYGEGHSLMTAHGGVLFGAGSDRWGQLGCGIERTHRKNNGFALLPTELIPGSWQENAVYSSCGWMHSVLWCPAEAEKELQAANGKPSSAAALRSSLLDRLPPETLNSVLEFLPRRDALVLSVVCAAMREYVRHCAALWSGSLFSRYPLSYETASRALEEEKRRFGGHLPYGTGVDFVGMLARLGRERYATVTSENGSRSTAPSSALRLSAWRRALSSVYNFMRSVQRWTGQLESNSPCVLVGGPSGAGKSSLMRLMLNHEFERSHSALGPAPQFSGFESLEIRGVRFVSWDTGHTRLRPLWRTLLRRANGLVFVVDGYAPESSVSEICNSLSWCLDESYASDNIVLEEEEPGVRSARFVCPPNVLCLITKTDQGPRNDPLRHHPEYIGAAICDTIACHVSRNISATTNKEKISSSPKVRRCKCGCGRDSSLYRHNGRWQARGVCLNACTGEDGVASVMQGIDWLLRKDSQHSAYTQ